jgi:hypothetical protein
MTTDAEQTKVGHSPDPKPNPKHDVKTLPIADVEQQRGSAPGKLIRIEFRRAVTCRGPVEAA